MAPPSTWHWDTETQDCVPDASAPFPRTPHPVIPALTSLFHTCFSPSLSCLPRSRHPPALCLVSLPQFSQVPGLPLPLSTVLRTCHDSPVPSAESPAPWCGPRGPASPSPRRLDQPHGHPFLPGTLCPRYSVSLTPSPPSRSLLPSVLFHYLTDSSSRKPSWTLRLG